MDRLKAMSLIVAVAETGSISGAARLMKSPVATVSRTVTELERRLKAQLFNRTPRQLLLTDAGRSYVDACKRILGQVIKAERELSGEYCVPRGELAVTTPWGIGHTHLLPLVVKFLEDYPDISLRLMFTDRLVNMVDSNIDIAIRIGGLPDSSMIATRIGSIRVVVCGSPSYFEAHGRPKRATDLERHDCITVDDFASHTAWKFVEGNRERSVKIRSRLCVNTSEAGVLAAIDGAGLARVMSYKMDTAMRAGKLAVVLEDCEPEPLPVHVIHTPRRPMPIKLRTFLNWIAPQLKERLRFD